MARLGVISVPWTTPPHLEVLPELGREMLQRRMSQGLVHTARHCTTLPSLRLRAEFGAFTERLST